MPMCCSYGALRRAPWSAHPSSHPACTRRCGSAQVRCVRPQPKGRCSQQRRRGSRLRPRQHWRRNTPRHGMPQPPDSGPYPGTVISRSSPRQGPVRCGSSRCRVPCARGGGAAGGGAAAPHARRLVSVRVGGRHAALAFHVVQPVSLSDHAADSTDPQSARCAARRLEASRSGDAAADGGYCTADRLSSSTGSLFVPPFSCSLLALNPVSGATVRSTSQPCLSPYRASPP